MGRKRPLSMTWMLFVCPLHWPRVRWWVGVASSEYVLGAVLAQLHAGTRDQLADPADTDVLLAKLKHHVVYHHEEPSFEHLDFTWSYKAATLVYPKLLELVDKYSRDATRS